MKYSFAGLLPGALGLILFIVPTATVRAGSAVATDGHGGYGFAYGDDPMEKLRREAVRRCCRKSDHPDEVRVVFQTEKKGYGTILRFRTRDGSHIAAAGGASDLRLARRSASRYVAENGGDDDWEEVDSWEDQ